MIKKLDLQFHFNKTAFNQDYQDELKKYIIEAINDVFNELERKKIISDEIIIKIPKIIIELPVIDKNTPLDIIKKNIVNSTFDILYNQITEKIKIPNNENIEIINLKKSRKNLIAFFLTNGYLPWWFSVKNISIKELIKDFINENPQLLLKILLIDLSNKEPSLILNTSINNQKANLSKSDLQKLLSKSIQIKLKRLLYQLDESTTNKFKQFLSENAKKNKINNQVLKSIESIQNKKYQKAATPDFEDLLEKVPELKKNLLNFEIEILPLDVLIKILAFYLIIEKFPDWSLKFIRKIKKEKQLHTDIQLAEEIIRFLNKQKENLNHALILNIISIKSIARKIAFDYNFQFRHEVLIYIYGDNLDLINRIISRIDEHQSLINHIYYSIINNYAKYLDIINKKTVDEIGNEIVADLPVIDDINQHITKVFKGEVSLLKVSHRDLYIFVNKTSTNNLIILINNNKSKQFILNFFTKKLIDHIFKKINETKYNKFISLKKELFELVLNKQLIKNPELHEQNDKLLYDISYSYIIMNQFTEKAFIVEFFNKLIQQINKINKSLSAEYNLFHQISIIPNDKISYINSSIKLVDELNQKLKKYNKSKTKIYHIFQKLRYRLVHIDFPIFRKIFKVKDNIDFESKVTRLKSNKKDDILTLHKNLIYYLKQGKLNWLSPYKNLDELIIYIEKHREEIIKKYNQDLINLMPNYFVNKRFKKVFTNDFHNLLNKYLNQSGIQQTISEQEKLNLEELHDFFENTKDDELYEKLIDEKVDWLDKTIDEQKIYINNAGLVLLCTFLPFLFSRLALIEKKDKKNVFINETAQQKAIYLTQYLVTGSVKHHESELVLNKLICGWFIAKPLAPITDLNDLEKKECNMLLNSAIKHWSILGSTSINGLRESFLKREGMIAFKDNNITVKIEQKGVDVLVTKIPWAYQTVKLSWNDYIIFVDWNA